MIGRYGDLHFKIPERKGKFALAEKLFILPSIHVVINTHAWIELRDNIHVVSIVWEIFVHAAFTEYHTIVNVIRPLDAKGKSLASLQYTWKIYTHHGVVDHIG